MARVSQLTTDPFLRSILYCQHRAGRNAQVHVTYLQLLFKGYMLHLNLFSLYGTKIMFGGGGVPFRYIFGLLSEESMPPLRSSDQSTWPQIQRSGFDSRRY
jgi:hypothetical protein